MQAGKLGVVAEGEIDLHALQVGPAVRSTIEDPVVRAVYACALAGPQPRVGFGVHPVVHPRRHEAGPESAQPGIHLPYFSMKACGERLEVRRRLRVLQLHHVRNQLIGPGRLVLLQDAAGNRQDIQRVALDDHVFELDAERLERLQCRGAPGNRSRCRTHPAII